MWPLLNKIAEPVGRNKRERIAGDRWNLAILSLFIVSVIDSLKRSSNMVNDRGMSMSAMATAMAPDVIEIERKCRTISPD